MKKMMKAAVSGLALVASLGLGMIAEAGSIPTNKLPLHTYAIRHVDCYKTPGGARQGYIDPGDYVIVTQIRSGWAYGSYPTKNGRTERWFKADDLVNNVRFANQERFSPKNNTYVYKNPSHQNNIGSFWGNEPITVVSDSGNSRQVIYKISGGYKMGWVPYWDCWTQAQAFGSGMLTGVKALVYPPESKVSIGYNKGVVTADTFNGVSAIYPAFRPSDGDLNWNCASYVKKYYKKIYGFEPYNLLPNSTPRGKSGKSFTKITDGSVKAGDVIGIYSGGKVNGHWAIAKGLDGDNIVLIEQNYRMNNNTIAPVNRRIKKTSVNVYRWL